MEVLDNFISPVPGFDGDIPIPVIPISARPPGDESMSDPSVGASASTLKTQFGKGKVTANPTPKKKSQETHGEIYRWDQNQ
jgi:hypothetical protein